MEMPRSKNARLCYRCADKRRIEASILIKAAQPTGAVYLAGYVVECMLKALNIETQPDNLQGSRLEELKRIGHNLTKLLELYIRDGGSRPPANVVRAFTLVSDWASDIRYDPREVKPAEADRFLKAVDDVYRWVDGRL
jgi:HEPN domain-containing protein